MPLCCLLIVSYIYERVYGPVESVLIIRGKLAHEDQFFVLDELDSLIMCVMTSPLHALSLACCSGVLVVSGKLICTRVSTCGFGLQV